MHEKPKGTSMAMQEKGGSSGQGLASIHKLDFSRSSTSNSDIDNLEKVLDPEEEVKRESERQKIMRWLFDLGEHEIRLSVDLNSLASMGGSPVTRETFGEEVASGLNEADRTDELVDFSHMAAKRFFNDLKREGVDLDGIGNELNLVFEALGSILRKVAGASDDEWKKFMFSDKTHLNIDVDFESIRHGYQEWEQKGAKGLKSYFSLDYMVIETSRDLLSDKFLDQEERNEIFLWYVQKRVQARGIIDNFRDLAETGLLLDSEETDDFTRRRLTSRRDDILSEYGTPNQFLAATKKLRSEIVNKIKELAEIGDSEWHEFLSKT